MTIAKSIASARQHLPSNPQSYAQVMSANIRAAMSDRAANAYRKAISEDGFFVTGTDQSALDILSRGELQAEADTRWTFLP
jgi:hypothetical protein